MKPNSFVFFGGDSVAKTAQDSLAKYGLVPSMKVSGRLDEGTMDQIRKSGAQFGILASYGKILREEQLELFPFGILNIHPSMLPLLRGPSPIKTAILEGLERTGTSIMLLEGKMDAGPILIQEEVPDSPRSTKEEDLRIVLMNKVAELISRVLGDYLKGEILPITQNETLATYTRKFTTEDAYIPYADFTANPELAYRKVLALYEEPGSYSIIDVITQNSEIKQIRLKILEASLVEGKFEPVTVQPEGKSKMPWKDFLLGNKLIA